VKKDTLGWFEALKAQVHSLKYFRLSRNFNQIFKKTPWGVLPPVNQTPQNVFLQGV